MIAWALVIGLSLCLLVVGLSLADVKKASKKKDSQIKMLMERNWNLKKYINDNGLV